MRALLLAGLMFLAGKAQAASGCFNTTGNTIIEKIRTTATGAEMVGCINRSFDVLSSSVSFSTGTNPIYGMLSVSTIVANNASGIYIGSATTMGAALTVNGTSVTASSFFGDGSHLTGMTATPSGAAGGDLGGTYPNPTVTHTQSGSVDFSTITTALNGKLSNTSGVSPGLIDLSTVTTALSGKLSNSAGVPPGLIDLSTVTTALDLKANLTGTSAITVTGTSVTASAFFGDASHLTGIPGGAPTGAAGGDLGGTYPNPTVTHTQAGSVDLSTVTTALAGKLATTGTAVAVASGGVDFSTITTALAGKLSTTGTAVAVAAGGVDFSTITTALAGKLSTTGTAVAVASGGVDFSTITTALNLKADLAGATFTGASGITNAAFTATGANGNIVSAASMTASAFFGDGSQLTGIPSTASISGVYLPLSGGTITGAVTHNNAAATTFNSTATFNSQAVFTNSASTQAIFYGASRSGSGTDQGLIRIGNQANTNGFLEYTSAGYLQLGNTYDAVGGRVAFKLRSAGTELTPLYMDGNGTFFTNSISTQATFQGSTFRDTNAGSGQIMLGTGARFAYSNTDSDLHIDALNDATGRDIAFGIRQNGTGYEPLRLGSDVDGATLVLTGKSSFVNTVSSQIATTGFASRGGANASSGQILVGSGRLSYDHASTSDVYLENISDNTNAHLVVKVRGGSASEATPIDMGDTSTGFYGSTLTVSASGNVGIGTTNPQGLLDVSKGSVTASAFFGDGSHLTGIAAGGETNTFTASSKTFNAQIQITTTATTSFAIGITTFNIGLNGRIGIGTSVPGFKIHMSSGVMMIDGTSPELRVNSIGSTDNGGISIVPTQQTTTGGVGGAVTITGGSPKPAGQIGGAMTIAAGAGISNTGGVASLKGGQGSSTNGGGALTLQGGAGNNGSNVAAELILAAGTGSAGTPPADTTLTGAKATSDGGKVVVSGGSGSTSAAKLGGDAMLKGANGTATSTPGDVYVLGGTSTTATAVVGRAFIGNGNNGTILQKAITVYKRNTGFGTDNPAEAIHLSSGAFLIDGSSSGPTGYAIRYSSANGGVVFGVRGDGLILSSSTIPSVVCDAGTPTIDANSTNQHGSITAGTAATNCTVTFSTTWPKTPFCWLQEETSLVNVRVSARSTTAFTMAGATISNDAISYFCEGTP